MNTQYKLTKEEKDAKDRQEKFRCKMVKEKIAQENKEAAESTAACMIKLSQKDVDFIKTKVQEKYIELEKENKKDVVKRLYSYYKRNVEQWVDYYCKVIYSDSSMNALRRLEKARWARQYVYEHMMETD